MFSRLIQDIVEASGIAEELEKGRALLNAAVPGGAFAAGTRLALGLEVIQSAVGDLPEPARIEVARCIIDALIEPAYTKDDDIFAITASLIPSASTLADHIVLPASPPVPPA